MTTITIPEGASIQETTRKEYIVTTSTTGPFIVPFPYFVNDDIVVYEGPLGGETLQLEGTDYTLTGTAVDGGFSAGSITFLSAISNTTVYIIRDVGIKNLANFISTGPFPIDALNVQLHKQFAILQQLRTEIDRCIKLNLVDTTVDITLPPNWQRLGRFLAFDAVTGEPTVVAALSTGVLAVTPFVEAFILTSSSALSMRNQIGAAGDDDVNVFTTLQADRPGATAIPAALTDLPLVSDGNYYLFTDVGGTIERLDASVPVGTEIFIEHVGNNVLTLTLNIASGGGYDTIVCDEVATYTDTCTYRKGDVVHLIHTAGSKWKLLNPKLVAAPSSTPATPWMLTSNAHMKGYVQQTFADVAASYQTTGSTNGGSTSTGWNVYPLNTEILDVAGIASVSGNQLIINPGAGWGAIVHLRASVTLWKAGGSQIKIYNATDGVDIGLSAMYWNNTQSQQTLVVEATAFVSKAAGAWPVAFQLEYTATQTDSNGLGIGTGGTFTINSFPNNWGTLSARVERI